ncbi:MAG: hypothetical protein ACRDRQ_23020 [Pseudonocardiaceae bacterium]
MPSDNGAADRALVFRCPGHVVHILGTSWLAESTLGRRTYKAAGLGGIRHP